MRTILAELLAAGLPSNECWAVPWRMLTLTLTDDTAATVQVYVDAKAAGQTPAKATAPTATVDLYQALMDSIESDVKKAGAA